MKTKFIILCLCLYSFSLHSQTSVSPFTLKEVGETTFLRLKNLQIIERTDPFDPYYEFVKYDELIKKQNEVFQTVFKSLLPEKKELLDPVTYCFYLDKDLKIYGFTLSFPSKEKSQLLEYEDLFFQFGNELKKIDLSVYLRPYTKERFQGSIYYLFFSRLKGMSEGKRYNPESTI